MHCSETEGGFGRLSGDNYSIDVKRMVPCAESQSWLSKAAMALSDAPFSILPGFQITAGYFAFSSFSAFATVLPPEVAKQTAVLPERSQLSRNVSMMRGAVYH